MHSDKDIKGDKNEKKKKEAKDIYTKEKNISNSRLLISKSWRVVIGKRD